MELLGVYLLFFKKLFILDFYYFKNPFETVDIARKIDFGVQLTYLEI